MTTRNWLDDGISTKTVSLEWRLFFYTHISIEENRECVVINNSNVVYKSRYYFHFKSDPKKLNIRYVNLTLINVQDILIRQVETADKGKFIDLVVKFAVKVKNPVAVLSLEGKPVQNMRSYLIPRCYNIIRRYKSDELNEEIIAGDIKAYIEESQFGSAFSVHDLLVRCQDIRYDQRIKADIITANQDIEILKKDFVLKQQEQQAGFDLKISAITDAATENLRQQKLLFDNQLDEIQRKHALAMREQDLKIEALMRASADHTKILTTAMSNGSSPEDLRRFLSLGGLQAQPTSLGVAEPARLPYESSSSGTPLIIENPPCWNCGVTSKAGGPFCPSCGTRLLQG